MSLSSEAHLMIHLVALLEFVGYQRLIAFVPIYVHYLFRFSSSIYNSDNASLSTLQPTTLAQKEEHGVKNTELKLLYASRNARRLRYQRNKRTDYHMLSQVASEECARHKKREIQKRIKQ